MSILDERILILTSTQKDSESTFKLLNDTRLHPYICKTFEEAIENIGYGAGALLVAKEVLVSTNLERLTQFLNAQESWSDLPVIVLASAGDLTQGKMLTINVLRALRNTTVLERPVRIATLVSVLESSIANRKRQYEVRDLVEELVQARREAEFSKSESDRANRTKSEFLANMSHEIRTPLGIILGFADLAIDERTSNVERKNYLSSVQRNGQVLLALVNDILDLAKVESGHIETEHIETSLIDVVNEIINALRPKAAEKNVQIHLNVQKGFPEKATTDPTRVRQIIMNILGNALKFTKVGAVSLDLSFQEIDDRGYKIIILVSDTGMGISQTQQRKLFQPFSQADSSMTREFGGTGLGLVLSRQLTRLLHGDLRLVGSIPAVGSKFEITFEVGRCYSKKAPTRKPERDLRSRRIGNLRILLAEDSPDNQFLISRILNQVGIEVKIANNGLEVIEKAFSESFDVILMDVQMPLLDGNEATKRLRLSGYHRPIVALTANALKGDKERALEIGFDDYITKPIQKSELIDSIERFAPEENVSP